MSGTSMTREMTALVDAFDWGLEDLQWVTVNAMKSAFAHFDTAAAADQRRHQARVRRAGPVRRGRGVSRPGDLLALAGLRSRAVERPDVSGLPRASRPPRGRESVRELGAGLAAGRLLAAAPRLAGAPRGDGGTVIDVPGWKAPEVSGAPLRAYLRWLGYDARGWGFGTNTGDPEGDARRLGESVVRLAGEQGAPVSLVGWSLGGVIAREVARRHPGSVRRVITYGTPVVGGPSFTAVARSYPPETRARAAAVIEQLDADSPIRVPLTVVFSRRDGVVAWPACLDRVSPDVEHVEVGSRHIGLGLDPDVWRVVADRLARPVAPGLRAVD